MHKLSHKLLLENIEWGIFINRYKSTIHVKELSILHVSLELYNVRPTHLLNTNLAQRYTRHVYTQKNPSWSQNPKSWTRNITLVWQFMKITQLKLAWHTNFSATLDQFFRVACFKENLCGNVELSWMIIIPSALINAISNGLKTPKFETNNTDITNAC